MNSLSNFNRKVICRQSDILSVRSLFFEFRFCAADFAISSARRNIKAETALRICAVLRDFYRAGFDEFDHNPAAFEFA